MLILMIFSSTFFELLGFGRVRPVSMGVERIVTLFLDCFVECWMAALIYTLLQLFGRVPAAIWKWTSIGLNGVIALLDIVCYNILSSEFNSDCVMLMKGTNPQETSEFFSFYFPADGCLRIALYVGVLTALLYLVSRYSERFLTMRRVRLRNVLIAVMLLITAGGYGYQKYLVGRGDGQLREMYRRIALWEALTYRIRPLVNPTPSVFRTAGDTPRRIVVIIGESLVPYHMSLYA